jgi:GTP-binding protein
MPATEESATITPMKIINRFQDAKFLLSAAKMGQLPEDQAVEIAFAGRSNAGKSSALNTLTRQKSLARISKTPGRTQLLNLFDINEQLRLVDLPGYGYAKVPEAVKKNWAKLIDDYLTKRENLCGIVLVMDIRHPLKPFDEQMIDWTASQEIPIHILLTKADKLKKGPQQATLLEVKKAMSEHPQATCQVFSSLKRTGLENLEAWINGFFLDEEVLD